MTHIELYYKWPCHTTPQGLLEVKQTFLVCRSYNIISHRVYFWDNQTFLSLLNVHPTINFNITFNIVCLSFLFYQLYHILWWADTYPHSQCLLKLLFHWCIPPGIDKLLAYCHCCHSTQSYHPHRSWFGRLLKLNHQHSNHIGINYIITIIMNSNGIL